MKEDIPYDKLPKTYNHSSCVKESVCSFFLHLFFNKEAVSQTNTLCYVVRLVESLLFIDSE